MFLSAMLLVYGTQAFNVFFMKKLWKNFYIVFPLVSGNYTKTFRKGFLIFFVLPLIIWTTYIW